MEESSQVVQVLQDFAKAFSGNDTETIRRLLSKQSVRVVGSDPAEYWGLDPDDVREKLAAQVEAIGGQMTFELNSPEGLREGDVGWIADQITVRLPDGNEVPFRFTGVVHQEDGEWRLVQLHLSMGVSNEEAVGEELPT